MTNQPTSYTLIYNLKEYTKGIYLPSAYIASIQKGELQYIEKRVYEKAFQEFNIAITPTIQQLAVIIEKLQLPVLEKKYNPKKRRKPLPLVEIMEQDRTIKKSITSYIHRQLHQFLSLIVAQDLILCWDIERKVLIKEVQVQIAKDRITPHLYFEKTSEHIRYILTLSNNGKRWNVKEKDVVPITNEPAWVFVDYQLYKIPHIKGLMLNPFQKKEEVLIPPKHIKTYFENFILKIASEVDLETKGFTIINEDQLLACRITWIEDIFTGKEGIKVEFIYQGVTFGWRDKTKRRSGVKFDGDEVIINRVHRDFKKEVAWIEQLKKHNLVNEEGSYFELQEKDQATSLFNWLAINKDQLEAQGFEVITPVTEGKTLILEVPNISFDHTQQVNDWFDIHGVIEVGEFKIPFKKLVPHLKKRDPFYPLPNGQYFLIPEEWFTRFKGLLQFARFKKDKLQLAKSQYTLLEESGIYSGTMVEQAATTTHYQPSELLKATLRPYQLDGVKWLINHYQNELGACLADDMGLGKTLQTIAVLLHAKERKAKQESNSTTPIPNSHTQLNLFQTTSYPNDIYQPLTAIILLPASLVFNWERELTKFAPTLLIYKHIGTKRHKDKRLIGSFDVILTTYQTALRDIELLKQIEFEYIVLDESQQIKNKDSKIFKATNQLHSNHNISLSGTPIEDSLSDLWSQMEFINPALLGSFRFFKEHFMKPIERLQDEDKKQQLQKMIQPYLLRRTKEAVAKDLPALTTKVFYSTMTCLLYTSPSPRDQRGSRMPSSA